MGIVRTVPEFIKHRAAQYNRLKMNIVFNKRIKHDYEGGGYTRSGQFNYGFYVLGGFHEDYKVYLHKAIIKELPKVVGNFKWGGTELWDLR